MKLRSFSCLLLALGLTNILTTSAKAQTFAACPETFIGAVSGLCSCDADSINSALSNQSIWGTGVFTDDSSVCVAAVHAGVIGVSGGIIQMIEVPGQSSYRARTRHGITSLAWESWPRSFIPASSTGVLPEDVTHPEYQIPAGYKTPAGYVGYCPDTAVDSSYAKNFVCYCSAGELAKTDENIRGTKTYTNDSRICTAARHRKVVSLSGGLIKVTKSKGKKFYKASTKNGVTSLAYGEWNASYKLSKVKLKKQK